jgi:RNA polymerase sigma-70 factor (ECF subfamily)
MTRDSDLEARARADGAMDRYAQGDASAFVVLYDILAPHLYGFAMNLARNRAIADDVVQQTFLQLHRARGRWVLGARVFPWAYAIAHNFFIDSTRRSSCEYPGDDGTADEDRVSGEPGVDDEIDSRRQFQAVMQQVQRLPERLRLAFQLVVLEGLSTAEAAEILGISTMNVKVRVHRARELLKRDSPRP